MMKSTQSRVAICAALLTAAFFGVSVAQAQGRTERVMATIPFGFYIGETLLPAGDYGVQTLEGGVVMVLNREAHKVILFHTVPSRDLTRESASAKLIFHRYGDDYFLAEMWWPNQRDFYMPMPSKRESQLAKASTPVRVAIAR